MMRQLTKTKTRRRDADEVRETTTATETTAADVDELIEDIDEVTADAEETAEKTADCVAESLSEALRVNYEANVDLQNEIIAEAERARNDHDKKALRDTQRRWDAAWKDYARSRDRIYESFGTTREAELARRGCSCGCDPWV